MSTICHISIPFLFMIIFYIPRTWFPILFHNKYSMARPKTMMRMIMINVSGLVQLRPRLVIMVQCNMTLYRHSHDTGLCSQMIFDRVHCCHLGILGQNRYNIRLRCYNQRHCWTGFWEDMLSHPPWCRYHCRQRDRVQVYYRELWTWW